MAFVIECDECGWKELRFYMTSKIKSDLTRYQQQSGKGICYKCQGHASIHQPKYKLFQKIHNRVPDKRIIKTYMSMEDVANGKGNVIDGCVIV